MLRPGLAVALVVILLDQASKQLMLAVLAGPSRFIEVTGFFNLVSVWNRGVSFGMLNHGSAWAPWLLSALALAVTAALVVWLRRTDQRLLGLAIGLVIGGAVGNVIDRVLYGAVFDFLDFHVGGWHWPAFNLADSAITVGVVLILLDGLFGPRKQPM